MNTFITRLLCSWRCLGPNFENQPSYFSQLLKISFFTRMGFSIHSTANNLEDKGVSVMASVL